MLKPTYITGPLFIETRFKDVKDPCIVFDGSLWHLYGSGGDVRTEVWQILHATAPNIEGPWAETSAVIMNGVRGDHVAAPSVYYDFDDKLFHMIVQTEFTSIGGNIEYLESKDGNTFHWVNTALTSIPNTSEAGIYDPHQVKVDDKKYIVYAGTAAIEGFHNQYIIQPDVHLAECDCPKEDTSWKGPWKRLGVILDHEHVDWHHNKRDHHEYEWGIEGPQIVPLPNGTFLLNATCFLHEGKFGTRQRIFFAIGENIEGPYRSVGPVLKPEEYPDEVWQSGENGHATAIIQDDKLMLFFQARSKESEDVTSNNWRYGVAAFLLDDLKL